MVLGLTFFNRVWLYFALNIGLIMANLSCNSKHLLGSPHYATYFWGDKLLKFNISSWIRWFTLELGGDVWRWLGRHLHWSWWQGTSTHVKCVQTRGARNSSAGIRNLSHFIPWVAESARHVGDNMFWQECCVLGTFKIVFSTKVFMLFSFLEICTLTLYRMNGNFT